MTQLQAWHKRKCMAYGIHGSGPVLAQSKKCCWPYVLTRLVHSHERYPTRVIASPKFPASWLPRRLQCQQKWCCHGFQDQSNLIWQWARLGRERICDRWYKGSALQTVLRRTKKASDPFLIIQWKRLLEMQILRWWPEYLAGPVPQWPCCNIRQYGFKASQNPQLESDRWLR